MDSWVYLAVLFIFVPDLPSGYALNPVSSLPCLGLSIDAVTSTWLCLLCLDIVSECTACARVTLGFQLILPCGAVLLLLPDIPIFVMFVHSLNSLLYSKSLQVILILVSQAC